jgi:hypothetical protein
MNSALQSCARTVSRRAHYARAITHTSPAWTARRLMSTQPQADATSKDVPPPGEASGSEDLAAKLQTKEDEIKELTVRIR